MTVDFKSETFLLDSYTGQGGFLDGGYLIQHPRESDAKFARRVRLAIRPNFVKKIVESYLGYLFRVPPSRKSESAGDYDAFQANADGLGHSLDKMMGRAQKLAMLLGTAFLIVDRETEGGTPYLSVRLPSSVASSTRDARGRLLEISFRETFDGQTVVRHFDAYGWKVADVSGSTMAVGNHNLGQIPVVALHAHDPLLNETCVASWIGDIARINCDIYNAISEMREIIRNQTFPVLLIPQRFQTDKSDAKSITVGTDNALAYDPADGAPRYIAPPDNPITVIQGYIKDLIGMIYQSVNLEYVSGFASGSGLAISYFFQQTQSSLSGMAAQLEGAETRIAALVVGYGGERWDGSISYSRDFDLQDLKQDLEIAIDALSIGISETFDKELKKRAARNVLGREVGAEVYAQIDGEIDATEKPYSDFPADGGSEAMP